MSKYKKGDVVLWYGHRVLIGTVLMDTVTSLPYYKIFGCGGFTFGPPLHFIWAGEYQLSPL